MKTPLKLAPALNGRLLPAVLLLATLAVASTTRADLLGLWRLDETTGTVAPNSAPGGTNGALFGGPTWINDAMRGQVLGFDGENGYVAAGTIPAIGQFDDFTWAFWTFQQQGENNDVIVGNRFGGPGWVKFTASAFEYRSADGGDINYDNIPQNQWVHHAVVKSGAGFSYYRDGVNTGQTSITTGNGGLQPFFLGGDSGGERWEGRLDDVAIYN